MPCKDCEAVSQAVWIASGIRYKTLCDPCRAQAVERYQRVKPKSSKADNDYSKE